MAVGDPVDPGQIQDAQYLVRVLAQPRRALTSAASIADDPIFVATGPDRRLPRRRGLRRLFRLPGSTRRHAGAQFSLLAALNAASDVQIYGTERFGLEAVAVAFGHVCIMADPAACDIGRFTNSAVRARIESELGPFVDPMLGVRASLHQARDLGEGRILAFFGRSVFVPGPEDQPVGRITIAGTTETQPSSEPHLPDDRPAGLYRGQAALAFARTPVVAPATCEALPDSPVAFILSGGEADHDLALVGRDMTLADGHGVAPSAQPLPIIRSAACAANEDAAFEVLSAGSGARPVRVGATLDVRPSRLTAERPGEACFAIDAIMAPADTRARIVDRWWIDLDRRERLVASAMTGRATTVICTDDRLEVYDWRERRFDKQQTSRFELQRMRSDSGRRMMLRRIDGRPFGFVAAPPKTIAASFDQRWWHHDLWALDWLDFAGAIETPSGDIRRLAADTALANAALWMPGLTSAANDLPAVVMHNAARGRFEPGWTGELAPEATFLVGPLVLAFRPAGG
jgi:hypothetical protein